MFDKYHFARTLKDLRKKHGLTQGQLAEKLGVSRGAISYYETGGRTPDCEFLVAACDYFEVNPATLLGYKTNQMFSSSNIAAWASWFDGALRELETRCKEAAHE